MDQMGKRRLIFLLSTLWVTAAVQAQDTARFIGNTLANMDYAHGQLPPALGVHNIQMLRANREHPEMAEGTGWTYNHAPNMAYWNGTFYVQYLSDPVSEHEPPGQTLIATSTGGYHWSVPEVVFPPYKVPDGTKKNGAVAHNVRSVMHQRMGFYVADNGRLLTLAYHGLVIAEDDDPNDGDGIGRVVREVKKDGSYGPIYFINYNDGWSEENTYYPYYTSSPDKGFVEACTELRNTPLIVQQWVEEADRGDPLIPLNDQFKALSYYHLPDGRVVGFWKHALTSISLDDGRSWEYHPVRAPGFVTANAKQWAQRTSDGRYVLVYNPAEEYRWPLALSVSEDGLVFDHLWLVNGEVPPRRYIGHYKSYGPQYVRGILEGNGTPPDGDLWLTYSMNKEDIWVASVPVPIKGEATEHVDEDFSDIASLKDLQKWNIYSPLWAPVSVAEMEDGTRVLALSDRDRYDYARVDRLFPESKRMAVEFSVTPAQSDHGTLHIELQDAKGTGAIRIMFSENGFLEVKVGPKNWDLLEYEAGEKYNFRIEYDARNWEYKLYLNGDRVVWRRFYVAVNNFSRIIFRTGERRYFPTIDTMEEKGSDLPKAGEPVPEAAFYIHSVETISAGQSTIAVKEPAEIPEDLKWSERMALSVIKQYTTLYRSWGYVQGVILHAFEQLWHETGDRRYLNYIRAYANDMIKEDGTIKTYEAAEFNIDNINAGRILFNLYEITQKEKYKTAIETLRNQLRWQPRTSDGGFWHKLRYPWQMWLDGAYMGSPFLAQYAKIYGAPEDFDTVAHQLLLMEEHMRDPETGLFYHGWDESRLQSWSDPETGVSSSFWGRAMGWYGMALVDVLDFLPANHEKRDELIHIFRKLTAALEKYQDAETGLWYQVVDQGGREGNYLEGSASSMFVYMMAKGVNEGYLDQAYMETARKGYQGIIDHLIEVDEEDGQLHMHQICAVAGLGPDRDGSYKYYINESIRSDDMKALGPFILAGIELDR